jgi:hypothetical protein
VKFILEKGRNIFGMKTTINHERRNFLASALRWTAAGGALVLGGCGRRRRPTKTAAPRITPPRMSGIRRLRLYVDIRLGGIIFNTRSYWVKFLSGEVIDVSADDLGDEASAKLKIRGLSRKETKRMLDKPLSVSSEAMNKLLKLRRAVQTGSWGSSKVSLSLLIIKRRNDFHVESLLISGR